MKRILLMIFRNILYVPFGFCRLLYYAGHVDKYTDEQRYALIKKIDYKANRGGRITIDVHGAENIPDQNGFIFYPNHQGLYDVLAVIEACPVPFSVINKKEVQDIIFLKQIFKCMKAYSIDREDIKQSMQVILNVARDVKNGSNFLIFAEGTRSRNGNELLEFKGGSFKSAMKAKCPIVPVAIIDSYKSFDTNSIKKLTVQVHFLKPMEYEDYKDLKSTEIAKVVKSKIEETIKNNEKSAKNR
jgi:1-acyl-sn-glycerol-3-phosphate acyltransferase